MPGVPTEPAGAAAARRAERERELEASAERARRRREREMEESAAAATRDMMRGIAISRRTHREHDELADAAGPVSVAARADGVRICTWNLRNLGAGATETLYRTVIEFLRHSCDVVVVVEIRHADGAISIIADRLGADWGFISTTDAYPLTSRRREHYVVLHRQARATTCAGWAGLERADGFSSRFARPPAFVCISITTDTGCTSEIMVAGFHATFASPAAIRSEVEALPAIVDLMRERRPGAQHYVIAGDYNMRPTTLRRTLGTDILPTTSRQRRGSTVRRDGLSRNIYDHVLGWGAEGLEQAIVADPRSFAGSTAEYFAEVTDHLPAVAVMHCE